ncbi:acrosin-like [Sphaerodactylus townsendi]|uniref:acrosin-like n=1 Tax=Sphaerodactylus townsendi TaxID=933632 RepID=UPI002025E29E|nr:acrosin-like [Sphaerodactylus townsendi]
MDHRAATQNGATLCKSPSPRKKPQNIPNNTQALSGNSLRCQGGLLTHTGSPILPSRFINVRYWRVLVGATDLSKPGPDAQVFTIKMLADHEQYSPIGQLNDIAVIELNQSVACNDYVQLACLPDGSVNMPALSHCYFSGWSTTDTKRYVKKPEILQEVKVNLLEVGACNSSRWVNKRIQDYNVCVMAEKGGKENCQGDGGAPLMCREGRSERFWITGIDSWGSGCTRERMTEVFVSTRHFSAWIQRRIKEMLQPQPQRKPVVLQRPNWTRPSARPTPTPVKRPVTWYRPRPSYSWVHPNYVPMPPPPPKWKLPIGRPKGSSGSWD